MPTPVNKLSPELKRWVDAAAADLKRTVLVHLAHGQDADAAVESLANAGLEVQSAGPGVVTGVSNAQALNKIAKFSWVVALSTPRRLETKL